MKKVSFLTLVLSLFPYHATHAAKAVDTQQNTNALNFSEKSMDNSNIKDDDYAKINVIVYEPYKKYCLSPYQLINLGKTLKLQGLTHNEKLDIPLPRLKFSLLMKEKMDVGQESNFSELIEEINKKKLKKLGYQVQYVHSLSLVGDIGEGKLHKNHFFSTIFITGTTLFYAEDSQIDHQKIDLLDDQICHVDFDKYLETNFDELDFGVEDTMLVFKATLTEEEKTTRLLEESELAKTLNLPRDIALIIASFLF
ncbi:MAG: hypothetical protein AAF380_00555 [Bacteroidota bacterium]